MAIKANLGAQLLSDKFPDSQRLKKEHRKCIQKPNYVLDTFQRLNGSKERISVMNTAPNYS